MTIGSLEPPPAGAMRAPLSAVVCLAALTLACSPKSNEFLGWDTAGAALAQTVRTNASVRQLSEVWGGGLLLSAADFGVLRVDAAGEFSNGVVLVVDAVGKQLMWLTSSGKLAATSFFSEVFAAPNEVRFSSLAVGDSTAGLLFIEQSGSLTLVRYDAAGHPLGHPASVSDYVGPGETATLLGETNSDFWLVLIGRSPATDSLNPRPHYELHMLELDATELGPPVLSLVEPESVAVSRRSRAGSSIVTYDRARFAHRPQFALGSRRLLVAPTAAYEIFEAELNGSRHWNRVVVDVAAAPVTDSLLAEYESRQTRERTPERAAEWKESVLARLELLPIPSHLSAIGDILAGPHTTVAVRRLDLMPFWYPDRDSVIMDIVNLATREVRQVVLPRGVRPMAVGSSHLYGSGTTALACPGSSKSEAPPDLRRGSATPAGVACLRKFVLPK